MSSTQRMTGVWGLLAGVLSLGAAAWAQDSGVARIGYGPAPTAAAPTALAPGEQAVTPVAPAPIPIRMDPVQAEPVSGPERFVIDPPPAPQTAPTPPVPAPQPMPAPAVEPFPVQDMPAPGEVEKLAPRELRALVAPLALYPDLLLAQVLAAATYPLEIVQAARWRAAGGDVNEIDQQDWDSSVKAVARFPEVLQQLNENLEWTAQLGQAYLNQPEDVLNAVQQFRDEARRSGVLRDTPQQQVIAEDRQIEIVPTDPQVIYVPRYDPVTICSDVYPYYRTPYYPTPYGVVIDDDDEWCDGFSFGIGVALGSWANLHCDWRRGYVACGSWADYCGPRPRYGVGHVRVERRVGGGTFREARVAPRWTRDAHRGAPPRGHSFALAGRSGKPAVINVRRESTPRSHTGITTSRTTPMTTLGRTLAGVRTRSTGELGGGLRGISRQPDATSARTFSPPPNATSTRTFSRQPDATSARTRSGPSGGLSNVLQRFSANRSPLMNGAPRSTTAPRSPGNVRSSDTRFRSFSGLRSVLSGTPRSSRSESAHQVQRAPSRSSGSSAVRSLPRAVPRSSDVRSAPSVSRRTTDVSRTNRDSRQRSPREIERRRRN